MAHNVEGYPHVQANIVAYLMVKFYMFRVSCMIAMTANIILSKKREGREKSKVSL